MTQIKGTFEGCGEAPAPLKLNEVFISHADSTLNTARSRAVTVNVSFQRIRCLFSLANGSERTKRTEFFTLFFMHLSRPGLSVFSHLIFFPLSYFCPITHPLSSSLYIVVSSWIWKPHSEVNVGEV